ncbi:hypothetical protein [Hydrogenophaga sp.]|jgi:hypothetical protein|nr:hypothetical protein [Hydrogenophaga sp.]
MNARTNVQTVLQQTIPLRKFDLLKANYSDLLNEQAVSPPQDQFF